MCKNDGLENYLQKKKFFFWYFYIREILSHSWESAPFLGGSRIIWEIYVFVNFYKKLFHFASDFLPLVSLDLNGYTK